MGDNDFPELMDTSPDGTMKEHIRDLQRGREIDATTIVSLRTALAAAERERDEAKAMLHKWNTLVASGCTPGGSEFHNDPEYTAKYIRERSNNQHELVKSFVKQRNAAIVERDAAKAEVERLRGLLMDCSQYIIKWFPGDNQDAKQEHADLVRRVHTALTPAPPQAKAPSTPDTPK